MNTDQVVIRAGADVVGPDGPLGKVAHVVVDAPTREISELVVQRPDGQEWVVPVSAVAHASDDAIRLDAGWSELGDTARPYAADEFEPISHSRAVAAVVPAAETTAAGRERPVLRSTGERSAGGSLQLREENLLVRKQTHDLGAVELRKEVVAEPQTIDVPVWHEELVVEHQHLDAPQPAEGPIGVQRPLRVFLREEVVIVDKQPVVTEEVRAGRRTVQETRRIETQVRREEARIEKEGEVELSGGDSSEPRPR